MPVCVFCGSRTFQKSNTQKEYEQKKGPITLHSYSSQHKERHHWIDDLRQHLKKEPPSVGYLCSLHFEESDYRNIGFGSKKCLQRNARPRIFKTLEELLDTTKQRVATVSTPASSADGKSKIDLNITVGDHTYARSSIPASSLNFTVGDHTYCTSRIPCNFGVSEGNLSVEAPTITAPDSSKDEGSEIDFSLSEEDRSPFPQAASDLPSDQGNSQDTESYFCCLEDNLENDTHLLEPQDLRKKCSLQAPRDFKISKPKLFTESCPSDCILSSPKSSILDALRFGRFGLPFLKIPPQVQPLNLSKDGENYSQIQQANPQRKEKVMNVEIRKRSSAVLGIQNDDEPINLTKKSRPLPPIKVLNRSNSRTSIDLSLKPTKIVVRPIPLQASTAEDSASRSTLEEVGTTPEKRRFLQEKYPRKRKTGLKYNETPIKKKLRTKLKEKNRYIKTLNQKLRRRKSRLALMDRIIDDLRVNSMMSAKDIETLKNIGGPHKELIERELAVAKKGKKQLKYGQELRKFALTLHYKSPSAYSYVRKVFCLALPHPKTIYRWYKVIGGSPGFTAESFEALCQKYKETDGPIYGALIIDEMSIRRHVETDGKKYYGFVDLGPGFENDAITNFSIPDEELTEDDVVYDEDNPDVGSTDESIIAKECLTIMLVCVNGSWKVPLGYFLVNSLTGIQKATLITQCLRLLEDTKVKVKALTSDGIKSNLTCYTELGCKLDNVEKLQTWFINPVNGEKIYVLMDHAHMIKLVRNTIGQKGIIYDSNDQPIKWAHIELLHEIQEADGVNLGNKLTSKHIRFDRNKMKVALATQVLSTRVADSLQFLKETDVEEFSDCEALINFLRRFDKLFDIGNSKNQEQLGAKKALCPENIEETKIFFKETEEYVKGLQIEVPNPKKKRKPDEPAEIKIPIVNSNRKTGFLGFLVNMLSFLLLYEDLVVNGFLDFLATHKFCQDHLEMFFGILRSMGGFNNNLTARQLNAAYKKLLVHMELQSSPNGNCIPLENISILTCGSRFPEKIINSTTDGNRLFQTEPHPVFSKTSKTTEEELDLMFDIEAEEQPDHLYCVEPSELSYSQKNVISYIGGFIIRRLSKILKCSDCVSALIEPKANGRLRRNSILISIKDRGGLYYPSDDATFVLEACKRVIRFAYKESTNFAMQPKYTPERLTNYVVNEIRESGRYATLFSSLELHTKDQEMLLNHKFHLLKSVCLRYTTLRCHHICKGAIQTANSKRQIYNKLLLFKGQ